MAEPHNPFRIDPEKLGKVEPYRFIRDHRATMHGTFEEPKENVPEFEPCEAFKTIPQSQFLDKGYSTVFISGQQLNYDKYGNIKERQ